MGQGRCTRKKTFAESLIFAFKNAHNLLSIFCRYDLKISRGARSTIYFLRMLTMLAIAAVFFQAWNSNGSVNYANLLIICIFSVIVLAIITFVFTLMLSNNRTYIHPRDTDGKSGQSMTKIILSIIVVLVYVAGMLTIILYLPQMFTSDVVMAIIVSFIVQLAQDILLTQPAKVLISALLIKSSMNGLIEDGVVEAFKEGPEHAWTPV